MKEKLERIDKLLMAMEVRGDSVMILAEARMLLGEIYRDVNAGHGEEKTP